MILAPPGAAFPLLRAGWRLLRFLVPCFLVPQFQRSAPPLVALSVRLVAPLLFFDAALDRGANGRVGYGGKKRTLAEPADVFSFPGTLLGAENHYG